MSDSRTHSLWPMRSPRLEENETMKYHEFLTRDRVRRLIFTVVRLPREVCTRYPIFRCDYSRAVCVTKHHSKLFREANNAFVYLVVMALSGCAGVPITTKCVSRQTSPPLVVNVPVSVSPLPEPIPMVAVVLPFRMNIDLEQLHHLETKSSLGGVMSPVITRTVLTEQRLAEIGKTYAKNLVLLLQKKRVFKKVVFASEEQGSRVVGKEIVIKVTLTSAKSSIINESLIDVAGASVIATRVNVNTRHRLRSVTAQFCGTLLLTAAGQHYRTYPVSGRSHWDGVEDGMDMGAGPQCVRVQTEAFACAFKEAIDKIYESKHQLLPFLKKIVEAASNNLDKKSTDVYSGNNVYLRSCRADCWAVVIGVDSCKIGKLDVCVNDAKAMANALQHMGYAADQMTVLTDDAKTPADWPSIGNIRRAVEDLARAGEEGDTILFFFSGHGIMHNGEGYLVPTDGNQKNAILLNWVDGQLAQSKASTKLLILDACHAGAAKGIDGIVPNRKTALNVCKLLSCDKDQLSWPDKNLGQSVFTKCLIDGLSKNIAGDDKKLTLSELYDHVRKNVKRRTYNKTDVALQTPVLLQPEGEEIILADFTEKHNK